MKTSEYWIGARTVAPLAVAVGALGVLFGYLAVAAGFAPLAAVLMSATTFAGSAQFAAVAILGAGGTIAAAVGTAALLNSRYLVMGSAIAPALRDKSWKRFLLAQLVVDETWGVAYLGEGSFSRERLIGAGMVLLPAWVFSTAIGTVAGNFLGDPSVLGLDAAFPALLVVLLWQHLTKASGLQATLLGAAIALALIRIVPPGIPILAAASAALLGLRRR